MSADQTPTQSESQVCECGHPKTLHLSAGECPYRLGFFKPKTGDDR